MKKVISRILAVIPCFISCKQPIIDPSEEYHLRDTEVTYRSMPCDPETANSISSTVKLYCNHLNLYPIENGFDSVELRIWFENRDNITDSAFHLLLFKKAKQKNWTATMVNFAYPLNGGVPDRETLPTIKSTTILFKLDSLNFFDSSIYPLLEVGRTFKQCDRNYQPNESRNDVLVELALEGKYYCSEFPMPSNIKSECAEMQRLFLFQLLLPLKSAYNYAFLDDYLK